MSTDRDIYRRGRLTVRLEVTVGKKEAVTGLKPLNLGERKDGFIYVPSSYNHHQPASLAVMLHGSGGQAEHGLSYLRSFADAGNLIIIAPASRGATWDIIAGESLDQDVIFINQALAAAFKTYSIDPAHIAIGGFSDGASYALCLGLSNGDLFTHILAFSPGFVYTMERKGKPAVFISHGLEDRVLPIGPCSRRIVSQLEQQDYCLNYQEFGGAHEVPADIAKKGVEWFLDDASGV